MTDVVIAGIGQTEVGEHWEIGLRELAFAAIQDAVRDAGGLRPQSLFVGNMLAPNLSNQAHLGVLVADYAGLLGIEAVTIEAAGASGGARNWRASRSRRCPRSSAANRHTRSTTPAHSVNNTSPTRTLRPRPCRSPEASRG